MKLYSFGILVVGGILAAAYAWSAHASGSDLTGPQVLDRCRHAYEVLQSYQGTTEATRRSSLGGRPATNHASATVLFVRPGRIRVEGRWGSSRACAFVSDGRSIWMSWDVYGGKWRRAHDIETAITSFASVSQSASTTIPALLLHARWGDPFDKTAKVAPKVQMENVNGRRAYRVEVTDRAGQQTYWVDQKTFLLVKLHRYMDSEKLLGQPPRVTPQGRRRMRPPLPAGFVDTVQTFVDVKVNAKINPQLFSQPAGASAR